MTQPGYSYVQVHDYRETGPEEREMAVSAEYPVNLSINGSHYATIACSGTEIEYLVTGHLISEGIVLSVDSIQEFSFDPATLSANVCTHDRREISPRGALTAAGGRGRLSVPGHEYVRAELPEINAGTVSDSMESFLNHSREHHLTGGVHSSALCTVSGDMVVFFDEIGRHNAVDKVIGYAARKAIPLADKMILSTGRISSEIMFKLIYARAPVLVSRASPTSYSVNLARQFNILTICRARQGRFTVINGNEQIV